MKIIKSCKLIKLKNSDLGEPAKLVCFLFSAVLSVGLIKVTVTL